MSKAAKAESRARYLPLLEALGKEQGFHVHWLTNYQARVNGRFDLYISTGKWHDIRKNKRGQNDDLVNWVRQKVGAIKAAVKKKREEAHVFRLWNLKTGTWASDRRHMGDSAASDCVKEKVNRVLAADPSVKEQARRFLFVTREDDTDHITRRQARFDQLYPHIAVKRGILA